MTGASGDILFRCLREGVLRSAKYGDWRGSRFFTPGRLNVAKANTNWVVAARQGL